MIDLERGLVSRDIFLLDQSVLLAKNLTVFL